MSIARLPSHTSLIMADDLARLGARFDDEAGCILVLRSEGWLPTVIHDHLDEAREHARAGRGVAEIRRAA